MKGNPEFMSQPKDFWAMVRALSEALGYTTRQQRGEPKGDGTVRAYSPWEMGLALQKMNLRADIVLDAQNNVTPDGQILARYFQYRADVLNNFARIHLMTADEARDLYELVRGRILHPCNIHFPMNKQKGLMKQVAFLTALVNMLMSEALGGRPCCYDPCQLTTFTRNGAPVRVLSRRVDGAFPSPINPIGIWEIKEYYYTTSFGSRIADGVYETLLDGMELQEVHNAENIRADHLLVIDGFRTWWLDGKSYLCRIIDMLNMGYVSEVIFGREIMDRIPVVAREWAQTYEAGIRAPMTHSFPPGQHLI